MTQSFQVSRFRWVVPRRSAWSRQASIYVPGTPAIGDEPATDDTPISLVGARVEFWIASTSYISTHGGTVVPEVAFVSAAGGTFALSQSTTQTNMSPATYEAEIWITLSGGLKQRWAEVEYVVEKSLVT
jgi:hypothetical protein